MARLPNVGGDTNQWGQLLNDFLAVEHNADGTLKKAGEIAAKEEVTNKSTNTSLGTSNTLYPSQNAVKSYVDTALSGAAGNYITNGTSPQTANFNISGNGVVGGTFTNVGHSAFGNTSTIDFDNPVENYIAANFNSTFDNPTTQYYASGIENALNINLNADWEYFSNGVSSLTSVSGGSYTTGDVIGVYSGAGTSDAISATGTVAGAINTASNYGTGTVATLLGASIFSSNESTGPVTIGGGLSSVYTNAGGSTTATAYGVNGSTNNTSTGTVTTAHGGRFRSSNSGAGTISTGYGVLVRSAVNSGGGTFTNNYGLYIENQTSVGSTNSYNLYSAGTAAKNYIDGKLQIGSTQTSARVHIGANTDTTAAGGILFGTDTNLYRSATSTLSTTSSLVSTATSAASSGAVNFVTINPTLTQTATAGYTALLINPTETTTGSGTKNLIDAQVGGSSRFSVSNAGTLTLTNAANIVVGTTTGTKVATATTQKLGFWNATPIVQPATGGAAATFAANSSAIANDTATYDGYTIGQVVKALRNAGILA